MSSLPGTRYTEQDTRTERRGRSQTTHNALTTCLWFNTEAEQAATFYTGVFKESRLGRVHRHTEAGPGRRARRRRSSSS